MKTKIAIFTTIVLSMVLLNCTNDDDSSPQPSIVQTSIVGTWDLDYYLENGTLVEEIQCNRQLKYKFLSNGAYTLTTFAGDDINNCLTALIINGTWEYLGDNEFSLLVNGDTTAEEITITYQDNFTSFMIVRSAMLTEVYERE